MRRVALALFLAAVVPWSGARAETVGEAVAATNETFEAAFNKGDAAAVARLYTPDGAVLPPGAPRMDGREAIERFWNGVIGAGAKGLSLESVEVVASGDWAHEVGTAAFTLPTGSGADRAVSLKYVVVWRQDAGGAWQLHRDIWNEDPAGAR